MRRREYALLGVAFLVLAFFCLDPFLQLLLKVFFADGAFSLQPLFAVFARHSAVLAVRNTFLAASGVSLVTVAVAVPLAWIVTRANLGRSGPFFRSAFALPFAVPPYVGAIAWIYLANPATGLLNRFFGHSVFDIYSWSGLIFVEASFLYAFVFMMSIAAFDRMDSSLEEAARLSGASALKVFFDINLPLLRTTLTNAGLLVFLATAASFGVPALIGGPAHIYLVTTQIYMLQRLGSISGLLRAGALSSVLLVFALGVLSLSSYLAARRNANLVSGKISRPSLLDLGSKKFLVIISLGTFWSVTFLLPVMGVALASLSRVQGEMSWPNFSFEHWHRTLFQSSETLRAFSNSLLLAAGAATTAVLLSVLASYVQTKTHVRGRRWLGVLVSLPYATPGTVLAFALILTFSGSLFGILPSLYNTLALILLAYLIKYLSFAVSTVSDGFSQIDDVLAEAARVSGATWAQTMTTIWIPLLAPALVAAWFLVFMPSLSELTMSVLLTGPGLETIGTTIFQLQDYADAGAGGAAVLSMIVIAAVVAINTTLKVVSRGRYGL